MGKPELGMKHSCASCATRFYDMGRDPAPCPRCGTLQARPVRVVSRRALPTRGREVRASIAEAPFADGVPPDADAAEAEDDADDADDDGVPPPIDEDDADPPSTVSVSE